MDELDELADVLVTLLRSGPGQFDVTVDIAGRCSLTHDVLVTIGARKLDTQWVLPQAAAWRVLDAVLQRVPIVGYRRTWPVAFGSKPDHHAMDVPWGLRICGEAWARYGDARGVLTYRNGATAWREQNGDPGHAQRYALMQQRFPDRDLSKAAEPLTKDRS